MTNVMETSLIIPLLTILFSEATAGKNYTLGGRTSESHHVNRRGLFMNDATRWKWDKGLVPYVFSSDEETAVPAADQKEVLAVMRLVERFTCIRFMPWRNVTGVTTNTELGLPYQGYLNFVTSQTCCWSFIGNLRKKQDIYCGSQETCLHELGHALGLLHEQDSHDPNRNWMIRLNPQYNYNNVYRTAETYWHEHTGYDIQSVMHYGPWDSKEPAFTRLFPEIIEKGNWYYFMLDISRRHSCGEMHCANSQLDCRNEGYLDLIDGVCNCRCLPGLDPASGCTKILKTNSATFDLDFPSGSYGTMATDDGCPDGSSRSGYRTLYSTKKKHVLKFCVTDHKTSATKWPYGNYCLFRKGGSCPEGFESSETHFDDMNDGDKTSFSVGVLPDGTFNQRTSLSFCCWKASFSGDEIVLPRSKPLTLIKTRDNACPAITGMHFSSEDLEFHNPSNSSIAQTVGEESPVTLDKYKVARLVLCKYRPANIDCGRIVELSKSQMSAKISSPKSKTDLDCTWLIKVPPGENLILKFDKANIDGKPGNCKDTLEVEYNRPGHNGFKLCGSLKDRSYRSINNTIRLRLKTYGESASSFSASVKFIDRSKSCYNTEVRGMDYAGIASYFTRSFERCLPWETVAHCPDGPIEHPHLIGRYCRNPNWDTGIMPWCYTSAELCERNYCDTCQLGGIFDREQDCDFRSKHKFCTGYVYRDLAKTVCAKTCGLLVYVKSKEVSKVTCSDPEVFTDGDIVAPSNGPFKSGDTVTYRCKTDSNITRVVTCLSNGKWTRLNQICSGPTAKCGDVNPMCQMILQNSARMCNEPSAASWCAYTCGHCDVEGGTPNCTVPTHSQSVITNETRHTLSRGQFFESKCKEGYFRLWGNPERACLPSGKLSGSQYTCFQDCPEGWMYLRPPKMCYKQFKERLQFDDAYDRCVQKGGLLAMPKTEALYKAMDEALNLDSQEFWIGLHWHTDSSQYRWVDMDYLIGWENFADAGPHNKLYVTTWMGKWYDLDYEKHAYSYVCEVSSKTLRITCKEPPMRVDDGHLIGKVSWESEGPYRPGHEVTYKCDTAEEYRTIRCLTTGQWSTPPFNMACEPCSHGWSYLPETNHCYKAYKVLARHIDAKAHCKSQKGSLAMPKTRVEYKHFTRLGSDMKLLWLGMKGSKADGFYTWDDGERLAQWARDRHGGVHPNISDESDTMCVRIWKERWYDVKCWWKSGYICQVPYHQN